MPNTLTKAPRDTVMHRLRYYISASNAYHWYEKASDTADSMAKWDNYDSDPSGGISNRHNAAYIIMPFKCRLKGFQSIATTFTTSGAWTTHLWYGTPVLEAASVTNLTEACTASSSHNTRFHFEDVSASCDVVLNTGDCIMMTVKRVGVSTTLLNGTITIFMERV